MKIVKPEAKYLDPTNYTSYRFMEKVGRICYKSEDAITEESAPKFVASLAKNGHFAMLEHGYLYFTLGHRMQSLLNGLPHALMRYVHVSGGKMSASFTALYYLLNEPLVRQTQLGRLMLDELQHLYPEIFGCAAGHPKPVHDEYEIIDRVAFVNLCLAANDTATLRECLPHTILFTIDRGVSHEMARHRPPSFGHESTRYCNYAKGKFGSEITVVEPFWFDSPTKSDALKESWRYGIEECERAYMSMLANGAVAQEARAVLPNSLKSDMVVTATEAEWEHILNLRAYGTTGKPHPDMRRVMLMAAPLLHEHSRGRLYGTPYSEPKPAYLEPRYWYVTARSLGSKYPHKPVTYGGKLLRFDDEASASLFQEKLTEARHYVARPCQNILLDGVNEVIDATGLIPVYRASGDGLLDVKQDALVYDDGPLCIDN